jgi:hypothetical protein
MVLNVGCRRNAKGYWAWWMVLIIGFWVKAVSLLLEDLEALKDMYDA